MNKPERREIDRAIQRYIERWLRRVVVADANRSRRLAEAEIQRAM